MLFSPLPQDCGAKRTIPANSVLPIKLVFCIAGHDIRIAFVQFPSLLSLFPRSRRCCPSPLADKVTPCIILSLEVGKSEKEAREASRLAVSSAVRIPLFRVRL